ncbi:pantothenate transporter [Talaromyces proteolyticus]|uniref:Pantothenate transporter n=1 Tax=Talaromyces proteolyticus TaxID=1131652 RepID=A0AAD4KL10_9EURO|nr:pantothenate transporter [Talaromyces proteolyticus]KAH8695134.1 pantothenate transporter [Talaromyces proteolyticus]
MTGLSIKRVAVIGSGISGVAAAAHLLAEGLDVTVFERNKAAGGVWLFDERTPIEPTYPATKPSQGEVSGNDKGRVDRNDLQHAPPGPCYVGLQNNVSTPLLRTTLNAWPDGTPDVVNHDVIQKYIQDTSRKTGVEDVTVWGARVTDLRKDGSTWHVKWTTLHRDSAGTNVEEVLSASFDAVVVASGHYHAPRVPDLPGLSSVKERWPAQVLHSKSYRRPDEFAGKNVLLIGGGVSSTDIARELGPLAKNIYQSTRNGVFDLAATVLPENAARVNEIASFEIIEGGGKSDPESGDGPLPVTVHLKDTDQTIGDIHQIFICTGYHITLPFLPGLHEDKTLADNASDTVLVTDGTQIHNLHKDIFYIPDPTLAFIGVPYYTATFTLFEFQAIVLAAVFSGLAKLPSNASMKDEYAEKVRIKGTGKGFHSLKDHEEDYVKDILDWINAGRAGSGLPLVPGYSETWIKAKEVQRERIKQASESTEAIIQKEVKRKWTSYIWDTFDKSPEERRLLFKLDFAILAFASLGYFIKYLDQININNAFVSGMKEDLGLYQNQLNYMQACWTVGYVIGEIPSNMILTRLPPRYWIPAAEVLWSVLTFALSRANSARQFYILRFFIGLAESTFYPGMQYIVGSWYRKDELAKRSCIFHTSSGIGSMFSGYLMASVYHLHGKGGFKGWQWLFIVDGIISLPVAIAGFFILPDVPEISNPWYLSEKEIALAQKRMRLEGRSNRQPYTKSKFKKIFSSWHIYLLTLLYITFNNSNGGQPIFAQWLKTSKDPVYTVPQINSYPTTTYAVQVVTTLIYAWTSDTIFQGRRWPPIIFGALSNLLCYISLAVWNIPAGWKWFCYIYMGSGFGLSGLLMAWAHEICSDDNEERALTIGTMNEMAYVFQAWLPLIVWQQVDAPRYHKGFITSIVMSSILLVSTFVVRDLHHREDRAKRRNQERQAEDSPSDDRPLKDQTSPTLTGVEV